MNETPTSIHGLLEYMKCEIMPLRDVLTLWREWEQANHQ